MTIIKETVSYLIVLAVSVGIFKCVIMPVYIPSSSMEPTLKCDSLHFAYRLPYLIGCGNVKRGDVIVFKSSDGRMLCKRVIGIKGDEIAILDGRVYINCKELKEPYLSENAATSSSQENYTVPDGMLFVLGDNRTNSQDSRVWDEPYVNATNVYAVIV